MPNKIDKLFALRVVYERVKEEYDDMLFECREELVEQYHKDGTDRKTSPFFGKDAGKFSIKRFKAKEEIRTPIYSVTDKDAYRKWLIDNPDAAIAFAVVHAPMFLSELMETTGEKPDGTSIEWEVTPAKEEAVTAQIYSFKPDVVIEKLSDGGNLLEAANRLLVGDSE